MMKKARVVLLAIFALLVLSASAFAATADLTWTLPTTYAEDGSAIPAASIAQMVTVWQQASAAAGPWTTIYTSAAGENSKNGVSVTVAAGNTYYFRFTVTLNGKTSVPSDAATASLPFLTPGKPAIGNVILHP
jgi:uncharacterized protein (DUF2141 family)